MNLRKKINCRELSVLSIILSVIINLLDLVAEREFSAVKSFPSIYLGVKPIEDQGVWVKMTPSVFSQISHRPMMLSQQNFG